MSKTVNKVLLLGNVGKDLEIASTNAATLVANLSLATSERSRDKQGEWQERTEWHNLVAYARNAEILRDYVRKGSKLFVEGRLATRSWDDKGSAKKIYRTEVVVDDISLLSGPGHERPAKGRTAESSAYDSQKSDAPADFEGLGIQDSEIPF